MQHLVTCDDSDACICDFDPPGNAPKGQAISQQGTQRRGGHTAGAVRISRGMRRGSRGGTLQSRHDDTCAALHALTPLGLIDTSHAALLWQRWVAEPVTNDAAVWLHSDIHRGNLLVVDGNISALIDFGGLTLGDPAVELTVAWSMLSDPARTVFAEQLAVDPAQWRRGQAWALSIALIQLPYYHTTNPVLAATALRTINAILAATERGEL